MSDTSPLLLPVGDRRMSSWSAHQRRVPKSSEPGTDFYCPIGTPVLCPADGVIYGYGTSIGPATGRWVGVQFQNGMSFRALHLSQIVRSSGVVRRGEILGYSGASGYGVEDWSRDPDKGGAHTHVTLWPTAVRRYGYSPETGKPYTIDFMEYVGGTSGGGNTDNGDNELDATEKLQLSRVHDALVQTQGAFYYKPDAIINIQRGETQPRLDGIVARTDATNTTLAAVVEMLKELDPNKSADIQAFEVKLRESEQRTAALTRDIIESTQASLRDEIVAAIDDTGTISEESVVTAVDAAFRNVFKFYPETGN